jgi:excisionase family DNA binding protein
MIEQALRSMIREEVRAAVDAALQSSAPTVGTERLTVREAATVAKVSEKTIRNWLAAKQMTTLHAGRQLRVDRGELDRFMATGPKAANGELTPEQLATQRLKKVG